MARSTARASLLALAAIMLLGPWDGVARAEDVEPTLASELGARLRAAARDGELEPLLGERVLLREDEALVLRVSRVPVVVGVDVAAVASSGALRCEVTLVVLGGMRAERTRLTAEVDIETGATRALGAEVVRGVERHEVDGHVEAGQASLRVRAHRRGGAVDEQTVRVALPADAVAWPVVLALAPLLHHAALSTPGALRLSYPLAVLSGADLGGERHALVRADAPRALRLEPAGGGPAQVIALAGDGAVVSIEVPGMGKYARIDRAAAEKLPLELAPAAPTSPSPAAR